MSTNVYATEGILPIGTVKTEQTETQPQQTQPQVIEEQQTEQVVAEATITFEEEEYVRITQPLTEDIVRTFDSEMNIMGESRMDTELRIVTYTATTDKKIENPSEETPNYTEYKLKKVGATQTFSQLIKLYEGFNHIIIYYTYEDHDEDGMINIVIERKSEEVKEQIKNYNATDPKEILNQISK